MKAFAFDTETTGLVENRTVKDERLPEIIEFYGCEFNLKTGKIGKEINLLIKPRKAISVEITTITGITNEMVAKAPPFSHVSNDIKRMIEAQPLILAHNLSYDKEMVTIEMDRLQKKVIWPKGLCTVEQTIHLKGFRLSLTNLHEYLFGEPFSGAHRAKVDVAAMVRCCVELHKRGEL